MEWIRKTGMNWSKPNYQLPDLDFVGTGSKWWDCADDCCMNQECTKYSWERKKNINLFVDIDIDILIKLEDINVFSNQFSCHQLIWRKICE